jgi:hypothetical protein
MSSRVYSKLEVATEQLDLALRLYLRNKEYLAVITLAGAAEEILGVYLKAHDQPNALEKHLDASLALYRWMWNSDGSRDKMHKVVNRVKNGSKHMMGVKDKTLHCSPKKEAKKVLDRAVSNYYSLMNFENLSETPPLRKFNLQLVSETQNKLLKQRRVAKQRAA